MMPIEELQKSRKGNIQTKTRSPLLLMTPERRSEEKGSDGITGTKRTVEPTDSFEKGRKEEIVLFFRLLFSAPTNRQSSIRGNSLPPPPSSCPMADERNTS
jgi:hypothetical protein